MDLQSTYKAANEALTKVRAIRDGLHEILNPETDKIIGYLVRYQETHQIDFAGSRWHGNESDLAIFLISSETNKEQALCDAKAYVKECAQGRGGIIEYYEQDTPNNIDALHGVAGAILDTGGSEPEFISWVIFPIVSVNFMPKLPTH